MSSEYVSQGEIPLNTYQITALADQIRNTSACTALQQIIEQAINSVTSLISGIIQTQLDILADFFPILRIPGPNPFAIVKWIAKLVFGTAVTQYLAYVQYVIQLIDLAAALSSLISAIEEALSLSDCAIISDITSLTNNLSVINAGVAVALIKVSQKSASLQAVVGNVITLTTFNTSSSAAFKSSVTTNLPQFKIDSATFMDSAVTPDTIPTAGQVLTANTTGEPYWADNIAMRNRIINGNMYIAQRATSATVTAGTTVPTASTGYPACDRWFVYSTGANVTAAQVAGSGSNKNVLQITGAASVTAVGIGQRIEQLNSYDLAGQTCTLAVDISNSLLTTVTWTASYATTTADTFGTIGTPTKTQIATGTFTVTSTLTRYTANISVPAAATTGIEILFTVGAQISGTWQIGNVQFEAGSVATPFERLYYGTQLAQCQRYFFDTNPNSATTAISIGGYTAVASTYTFTSILFPVTMRSTPTISFRNQSYVNVTAIASGGASSTAFIPNVTSSAAGAVLVLYNYAAAAEIP